jgi:nucleoside recognition membrane protein YjiH
MKFYNTLEIASESRNPLLFISIVITAVTSLGTIGLIMANYPPLFLLFPIAAIVRVVYAFVKGK